MSQRFRLFFMSVLGLVLPLAFPVTAKDTLPLTGQMVAEKIYERDEGAAVSRLLTMEMVDKRGKVRTRTAHVYRRTLKDMKQKAIFFEAPRLVKDMAFLTYDRLHETKEDEQWLYMPAMRKVRRIPASKRGDYFLGTDFTYNDVKNELKFEPEDYVFTLEDSLVEDGKHYLRLSGIPTSEQVRTELGYGGFNALIAEESWMPVDIKFLDVRGEPLKHIKILALEQVSGIWTPMEIHVENLQTGHATRFTYANISYAEKLEDRLFSRQALKSGGRR